MIRPDDSREIYRVWVTKMDDIVDKQNFDPDTYWRKKLMFVTKNYLSHTIGDKLGDKIILSPILIVDEMDRIRDKTTLSLNGFSPVVKGRYLVN